MSIPFPSPEWVAAYGDAINSNDVYRQASVEWTHGAVALVVNAQPEIGLREPVGILLDLHRGVYRARELSRDPLPVEKLRFRDEREAEASRLVVMRSKPTVGWPGPSTLTGVETMSPVVRRLTLLSLSTWT